MSGMPFNLFKMKSIYFALIFLFLVSGALAQRHDNWWINCVAGLDTTTNNPLDPPYPTLLINFNASPPIISYESRLFYSDLMKLTISNRDGKALFHSNGYSVFHMDGTVMDNGAGITEDTFPSWYPLSPPMPMAMMGLPRPGHQDDYYTLHLEGGPGFFDRRRLILTLIAHATGPEEGIVEFKNKPLINDGHWLEFFQATRHANGQDWWVVISDADSVSHLRTFYSLFIGADTAYVANTQLFGGYEQVPPVWKNYTWQRLFTPDGKYLVTLDLVNGIRIHAFDRCTGVLGPLITLPYVPFIPMPLQTYTLGGIAISPNSRFLYVSATNYVVQYDLNANDIAASRDTIAVYDGFIDSFLGVDIPTEIVSGISGPDGKIYYPSSTYLHYIAKPNKKGAACTFVQHGIDLPAYFSGIDYFPNYRLGPLDGSACDTLGLNNEPLADFWWFADSTLSVEFADNSSYEPSDWHWDFGDGGMSQDTSPVYVFPAAGTYTVCPTVSNQYAADTVCKQVTVGQTGIQEANTSEAIRLFVSPNPADDHILVQWPGLQLLVDAHLEVYDLLGIRHKNVPVGSAASFAEVSVADLPAGLYCCRLAGQGRLPAAVKFLVLR